METPEMPMMEDAEMEAVPMVKTEEDSESYKACIPLPESMIGSSKEGDSFEGQITGTIINKDGALSVEVETLNGEPVESGDSESVVDEYTGKEGEDVEMNGPEALDKFMKGRKATQ